METNKEKLVVFALYSMNDNSFLGFRADTFNTMSKTYAKVYHHSKEQVDVVIKNIKGSMSYDGSSFMKLLAKTNKSAINLEGGEVDVSSTANHVLQNEQTLRNANGALVRVLEVTEDFDISENWKLEQFLLNANEIESHKIKLLENEN